MDNSPQVVTADTISLFQRRVERRAGEVGPWFGVPIRGFTAPGPGIVEAPFYFLATLSGLANMAIDATLEIESPRGARKMLGRVVVVFDDHRTALAHGPVVGFEVDAAGDYALRLVVNGAVVARTTVSVDVNPSVGWGDVRKPPSDGGAQ